MVEFIKSLFKKNYESLTGSEFKEMYKKTPGSVLVDVRTPGEFTGGAIRGARNIDVMSPSFRRTIENLDKTKTYFLYCKSGMRSGSACSKMSKLGFKVYNLSGGIHAW